jgi:uncharacterized protein (DUF924 family)
MDFVLHAAKNFVLAFPMPLQLMVREFAKKVAQDFAASAAFEDKFQFLLAGVDADVFQEFSPRGAMRRVTVDQYPIHIENDGPRFYSQDHEC